MSGSVRLIATVLATLCAASSATVASAASAPGAVAAWPVPACASGESELAAAPTGGVLLRLCNGSGKRLSSRLGHLLPDGTLHQQRVPKAVPGPLLAGPAGEVWAVTKSEQRAAAKGAELAIDRIAPDGRVRTFPLGSAKSPFASFVVRGLVADGPGAVWIAIGKTKPTYYGMPGDSGGGELVHIAADGTFARHLVPSAIEPQGLVRGPDGSLWFTGVSGRFVAERTGSAGIGWVGRLTSAGKFDLHRIPADEPAPGQIAVGPDGSLWFPESPDRTSGLGTIGVDGTFGPVHQLPSPAGDELTFGPEGDPWFPADGGVGRMTPTGQVTVYPAGAEGFVGTVVTGVEGDIWALAREHVWRIVPGGPGVQLTGLSADRTASTVTVDLSCGGASVGCAGTLDLELRNRHEDPEKPATERSRFRFVEAPYSVDPESSSSLTLSVPPTTFARGKRELPSWLRDRPILRVHATATVEGGPTLERDIRAVVGTGSEPSA